MKFLYAPHVTDEARRGNSSTWLLMTQGNGFWRTNNAGETWTQVSTINMGHGGAAIYYDAAGTLYAPGDPTAQRSFDNGKTWEPIGLGVSWSVFGTGTTLFSGVGWGHGPILVSDEADGNVWSPISDQLVGSPFEMAYDVVGGIVYASNWYYGLWAMKLP